jgi:glycosyltransferase involved in cell wall biosynthesis
MAPLNIWILQTGEPLHSDGPGARPMRAINLANSLVDAGHNVILWSSTFYHQEKTQRLTNGNDLIMSSSLRIRLIDSPGYIRNIGFERLWDHFILARNLGKKLRAISELPDVAFIGYPPIETAYVMSKWLSKNGVPYIVDAKDQWPEIFVNPLPVFLKPFGRLLLWPYFYFGRQALKNASGISAMAAGFLDWAVNFSGRTHNKNDHVVPLTAPIGSNSEEELVFADKWWDEKNVFFSSQFFRVSFIGSHTAAFDMDPVWAAAAHLMECGAKVQFVICGDGPCSEEWRAKASGLNNVIFPGWVDQAKISSLYARSNLGLAPYKNTKDFVMSIPNKVIDVLSAGLPLLSSLNGEVKKLIDDQAVGFYYDQSGESLQAVIYSLIEDSARIKLSSNNAQNLYRSQFSYEKVYGSLVKNLECMAIKI